MIWNIEKLDKDLGKGYKAFNNNEILRSLNDADARLIWRQGIIWVSSPSADIGFGMQQP